MARRNPRRRQRQTTTRLKTAASTATEGEDEEKGKDEDGGEDAIFVEMSANVRFFNFSCVTLPASRFKSISRNTPDGKAVGALWRIVLECESRWLYSRGCNWGVTDPGRRVAFPFKWDSLAEKSDKIYGGNRA